MKIHLYIVLLTLAVSYSWSDDADCSEFEDNSELAEIYAQDQADRQSSWKETDWELVNKRGKERQDQTLFLLRQGLIKTSQDYLHAAYVFQHGWTVEDARLALSLAWLSASIDPENEEAKWLTAGAWDRLMMRHNQPQWYATQFERNPGETEWRLYKIQEGAVTDEQRKVMGAPSINEAMIELKRLNEK